MEDEIDIYLHYMTLSVMVLFVVIVLFFVLQLVVGFLCSISIGGVMREILVQIV